MNANFDQAPAPAAGQTVPKTTQAEPVPAIVFPDKLRQERAIRITRLLSDPPAVDCLHVPGRSGPLAAAGLDEDADFVARLGLPPLIPIDGIGGEIYSEFSAIRYPRKEKTTRPPQR